MGLRVTIAVLTMAIGLPIAAMAQSEWIYVSNDGHQYNLHTTQGGVMLESLYPVARYTGMGARMQIIVGIESHFLGRDCDAFSKVLGPGIWASRNGAIMIEYSSYSIWFPRQELEMNSDFHCEKL